MKICISSSGPGLDDMIDPRFGRCQYFIIVDIDTMQFEAFDNAAIGASGGAGVQAARFVAGKGAAAVLTGNAGPNAFNGLNSLGIKIFIGISGVSVREAIDAFKAGKYQEISSPSVQSHFGMGQGKGSGRGMGMRSSGAVRNQGQSRPLSKDDEVIALKEQLKQMRDAHDKISKRIEELSAEK